MLARVERGGGHAPVRAAGRAAARGATSWAEAAHAAMLTTTRWRVCGVRRERSEPAARPTYLSYRAFYSGGQRKI